MNNTSQSAVSFGEPFASVTAAVAALTQPQLDRLLAIARRRMERLTQSPPVQRLLGQCDPADFIQDAILLVLVGELKPGQGRHTRPRHLASPQAFFNFLQGVVHSRISARLKKLLHEGEHLSVESQPLTGARTVVQDVQLNEIKASLSARLRAAAGTNPALQSTLMLLELEAMDSGGRPSRKQLHKMRRLGREVLKELAGDEEVNALLLA